MAYRKNPVSQDELRKLAQGRTAIQLGADVTTLEPAEVKRLLEDLEVHQIALEHQNEHLSVAREQLETALSQSCELYDFSPVGSLVLDSKEDITKMNLAAASLLGSERARLLGNRLGLFIVEADRHGFNCLLNQAQNSRDVQVGEIELLGKNGLTVHVQLRVSSSASAQGWQVILVDITGRRQREQSLRASEERWKFALEATGDGVWDWDVRTGRLTVSKKLAELYGYSEQEYGSRLDAWTSRIHPDDKSRVMEDLQRHLAKLNGRYSNEHRCKCKGGSWRWVLSRGAIVSLAPDGKPLRMIGTHVDIEQRKQAEQALAAATQFQQTVFDSLPQQIAVLNREGVIVQTNLAWRNYAIAHSDRELLDMEGGDYMTILGRMSGHEPEVMTHIRDGIAAIHGGEKTSLQLDTAFFAQASKRWFMLRATAVHDMAERVVISHDDVTGLKAAELASRTLANSDGLTGALSRRHFLELAEFELTRSKRYQSPLMLLMLDLDHFKHVNDQYGHAAGDAVLRGFVQTVMLLLRESDLIGRLGGEEFAVLLPNTTPGGGAALAQRIVESVCASPVAAECQKIPYTVSVGAGYLTNDLSLAELLRQADRALYRAKHGGRNRLEVESAVPTASSLDH